LVSSAGICCYERYVYHVSIVVSGFATVLTILDRQTLEVLHVQTLAEIIDAHSIARHGDELFVASTGTDEVIAYRVDGARVGESRLAWTPTGSGTDTHHINSVAVAGGQVVCSAFGAKEDGSWAKPKNGYIRSVESDSLLLGGLRQPHSVCWQNGTLYFCNSQEGTVCTPDGDVAYLSSYSRGLAFAPDGTIYAGTSLSRKPSQPADDKPVFHNPSDPGEIHGRCSIVCIPPDGLGRGEIPMDSWAHELYDIAIV
jgi:Domain of unknown function (DUF4915)